MKPPWHEELAYLDYRNLGRRIGLEPSRKCPGWRGSAAPKSAIAIVMNNNKSLSSSRSIYFKLPITLSAHRIQTFGADDWQLINRKIDGFHVRVASFWIEDTQTRSADIARARVYVVPPQGRFVICWPSVLLTFPVFSIKRKCEVPQRNSLFRIWTVAKAFAFQLKKVTFVYDSFERFSSHNNAESFTASLTISVFTCEEK